MHEEVEDFEQEFYPESGQFAIIDASVLDTLPSSVKSKAILVPTKHDDMLLTVSAEYDDTALRNLSIKPATFENDNDRIKSPEHLHGSEVGKDIELDKDGEKVVVDEGSKGSESRNHGPHKNNHDSPLRKRLRKTRKSRHHMSSKKRRSAKDPDCKIRGKINKSRGNKISRKIKANHRTRMPREEIARFLIANMGHPITEENLRSVENIDYLYKVLETMVSTCAGTKQNDEARVLNFDWVYNAKQLVESLYKQTSNEEAKILMESIDGRRPRVT